MRLAWLVLFAACSGPPLAPAIEGTAPPIAAPTMPPPSVRWIDNGFDEVGLPAVARDGALVVYGKIDGDGGRGNPNLTIVTADRKDAIASQLIVLGVDEVDTMFDAAGMTAPMRTRISDANRMLARLHTTHDLVPLAVASVPERQLASEDPPAPSSPREDVVSVRWTGPQLEIVRGSRRIATPPLPAAKVVERPLCATCTDTCSNAPFLGAAWVDEARKVALVRIDYTGTDTCWEPNAELHVVSW